MTDNKKIPVAKSKVATEVIKTLSESEGEKTKTQKLLSLVPEGHSPKLYLDLMNTQVLGVDREGKNRPDEDLFYFLYVAKRTGLDPLVRQIYAVYRWDTRLGREKMTIQTGIDGMRLVAQRQGDYAGQDDAKYLPEDESTKYPVKATVTVYKFMQGTRVPFTATARWGEYVQLDKQGKPMGLWDKMPYLMLAKCAEALALRKAFPNELSGIYSEEEMAQSKNILSDLPTPDKFIKPTGEIKVEHGAADDNKAPEKSTAPVVSDDKNEASTRAAEENTPDNIGTPEAAEITKVEKEKTKEIDKENVTEIAPDLGAMRQALKDKEGKK